MNEYCNYYPVRRGFEEIEPLFHFLNQNSPRGYIAGSYAAWMKALVEIWQPNDIDIFATSETHFLEIADYLSNENYTLVHDGEIVKGFEREAARSIQLITPHKEWASFPDDILESFDLTAGMAVLEGKNTIAAHHHAGSDVSKILKINDPIRTLKRVMKYHQRGVSFDAWELIKLFLAWDELSEDQKLKVSSLHQEPTQDDLQDYEFDFDDFFFEE